MRKLVMTILFSCIGFFAFSQNLTAEGVAPNQYVVHTVAPKENFYSVGRLYNQSPKAIAAFNNIVLEKGLTIGQQIKIPLNTQNLSLNAKPAAGENLIPVTHIVAKSETLFRIGHDNNVTPQMIKSWNNLTSDNISLGTPLIVGYIKPQNQQNTITMAAPATNTPTAEAAVAPVKQEAITPIVSSSAPVKKDEPFVSVAPVEKVNQTAAVTQPSLAKDTLITVSPASPPPIQMSRAVSISATAGYAQKQTATTSATLQSASPAVNNSLKAAENDKALLSSTPPAITPADGAFSSIYLHDEGNKTSGSKSGEAATFKSTSGWQDKKYYVLINDIIPGTILKITADNKYVYAKVLGNMPEMKENNGLLLRLSNSAASYLGITDPKFPVQVSYYQ